MDVSGQPDAPAETKTVNNHKKVGALRNCNQFNVKIQGVLFIMSYSTAVLSHSTSAFAEHP